MAYYNPARWQVVPMGEEKTASGEVLQYRWVAGSDAYFTGVEVVKEDRFGQVWSLRAARDGAVTVRVAAGLLRVTPMTVSNWINAGVFPGVYRVHDAIVIPVREVEQIARQRGIPLPF
jgi:hypothetical protein